MLPCSSERSNDVIIHWFQQSAGNLFVHSFYDGHDQLVVQNQRFSGRTSLFRDQLSSGNASLQLTRVKVQDEGRYKCQAITRRGTKESFITLKMDGMRHTMHLLKKVIVSVGITIVFKSLSFFPSVCQKGFCLYSDVLQK